MKIAVLGSGAVGGFYGARLALDGHEVTFVARGAHRDAIRAGGLRVTSPAGDFVARGAAEDDTAAVGAVDLVLVAVKTYDNPTALPLLAPLLAPETVVLTLQNGVDAPGEAAAIAGEERVLGGSAYIATAVSAPGVIAQTGSHQRIVFGEVFGARGLTPRVERLAAAFSSAGIDVEAVPDARVSLWEKVVYLSPFAGFTGAARRPAGVIWSDPHVRAMLTAAFEEVARIADAEGVPIAPDLVARIVGYMDRLPPSTRSSLLIDLERGRRTEVEALHGALVRRAARLGVATPILCTLYAVLRPAAS